MFFKTLEKNVFRNLSISPWKIFQKSSFKKAKRKSRIINWYWYEIIVEKEIIREIYHSTNRYAKSNKKYMKDYEKNEEFSYLKYWNVNNFYGWVLSQKLSVNGFE